MKPRKRVRYCLTNQQGEMMSDMMTSINKVVEYVKSLARDGYTISMNAKIERVDFGDCYSMNIDKSDVAEISFHQFENNGRVQISII